MIIDGQAAIVTGGASGLAPFGIFSSSVYINVGKCVLLCNCRLPQTGLAAIVDSILPIRLTHTATICSVSL